MSWKITSPRIVDLAIRDTTTTAPTGVRLGDRIFATDTDTGDSAEFILLTGVASTTYGAWVYWDGDFQTVLGPANATSDTLPGVQVAWAMSANVASSYGWYMISGRHPAIIKGTTVADKVNLFTSSVAGAVQTATVSGRYIMGAKSASSVNSTATTVDTVAAVVQYPMINPKGGTPA
jgi:hypothetical protein